MKTQIGRTQFIKWTIAIITAVAIWGERPATRVLAIQDSEDKPSPTMRNRLILCASLLMVVLGLSENINSGFEKEQR